MAEQKCSTCGRMFPAYYLTRGYCDGCKWDTWIPDGFRQREDYRMDPVWGQFNATRRPRVGVGFLDQHVATMETQLTLCKRKPRL